VEATEREALAPFERDVGENPYTVQQELQDCMQELVGIIRTEDELKSALERIAALRERAGRVGVEGHRQYNPGWHLAIDLRSLLTVSECVALAALERRESRGGHTRDDYPKPDPELGKVKVVVRLRDGEPAVAREPLDDLPDDLKQLFEEKPRS
jgi:succinate dehydrogenase / fumarate reductase, flavoprotein subunit